MSLYEEIYNDNIYFLIHESVFLIIQGRCIITIFIFYIVYEIVFLLYKTMYNYNIYLSLYKKVYNDNKHFHYIRICIMTTNIFLIHENVLSLYKMMYNDNIYF